MFLLILSNPSNRTLWNWNGTYYQAERRDQGLLIVPYGIETRWQWTCIRNPGLLIVPYGIETSETISPTVSSPTPSNRTLWNWNDISCGIFLSLHRTSNRTLWNWNAAFSRVSFSLFHLLIVPYGIETGNVLKGSRVFRLLIVPYGIETGDTQVLHDEAVLLIVPYGIETVELSAKLVTMLTSNRTLWNWNSRRGNQNQFFKPSNRTLWNWNSVPGPPPVCEQILLIVPYGIETGRDADGPLVAIVF